MRIYFNLQNNFICDQILKIISRKCLSALLHSPSFQRVLSKMIFLNHFLPVCFQSIPGRLSLLSCWLEYGYGGGGGGGVVLKSWLMRKYLCFYTIFSNRRLQFGGRWCCSINVAAEYILFIIILLFLGLFLKISVIKFVNPSSEAAVWAFAEWGLPGTCLSPSLPLKFKKCLIIFEIFYVNGN